MSILTAVERRSRSGIIFQLLVLGALAAGGVTMVYPFVLMFAGAMRSEMDSADLDAVPDYLVDDTALARKFLETKYNHNVTLMNMSRGSDDFSFARAAVPRRVVEQRVADLRTFVESQDLPDHWVYLGGTEEYKLILPPNLDRLIAGLRERYDDDLAALARDSGTGLGRWRDISFAAPAWTDPRFTYLPGPYWEQYFELNRRRPLGEWGFVSLRGWFLENVVYPRYGRASVEAYNAAHEVDVADYRALVLPRRVPGEDQPVLRAEWIEFATQMLNNSFLRAEGEDAAYRSFLEAKYGTIDVLNRRWQTDAFNGFDEISLPGDRDWVPAAQRQDHGEFLASVAPDALRLVGPHFAWRQWLGEKYGDVDGVNRAHEEALGSLAEALPPVADVELAHVRANSGSLRYEMATRNFRNVFDSILLEGRSLSNTIIYVVLSLILALTLQPLAAYALSRFEPPGTWRFILLFMATMAFPPMVGMIPQFLMLREAHLLNTFVALVLPVMVNGFLVFLLKGFFDSLPRHLYEAALIDGAGEIRMFLVITMSLSKPILAVVALQTFNFAWMSFMYPLLVCPDEDMQVLAVWLYDFQQQAATPAIFASILVTSIPTLLIFVFAQRTIMRGIAVPAEK